MLNVVDYYQHSITCARRGAKHSVRVDIAFCWMYKAISSEALTDVCTMIVSSLSTSVTFAPKIVINGSLGASPQLNEIPAHRPITFLTYLALSSVLVRRYTHQTMVFKKAIYEHGALFDISLLVTERALREKFFSYSTLWPYNLYCLTWHYGSLYLINGAL